MCLFVKPEKGKDIASIKPKTAKKDIVVWKIIYHNDNPIYNFLIITRGKKETREPYTRGYEYYIIENPFDIDMLKLTSLDKIHGNCFHSYRKKPRSKDNQDIYSKSDYKTTKFIIPKGARYYEGENGTDGRASYASDRIIFPE